MGRDNGKEMGRNGLTDNFIVIVGKVNLALSLMEQFAPL
jgi:hypothetical protein